MEKPITVRLPENIYNEIVKLATSEHRSLNGQIIFLLEKALKK
jgi:hypothetical protein